MGILSLVEETLESIPNEYYKDLLLYSKTEKLTPDMLSEIANKHNKNLNDLLQQDVLICDIRKAQNMLLRMMDDNLHNLPNSFKIAKSKGWDKIFVFVDIHATILEPNYEDIAKIYCPMAKEVLQKMSDRKDICLCLYTCSYPDEILEYIKFFKEDGIVFEHANENSETKNTKKGFFEDKPYMNVLLEDKAGFKSDVDWFVLDGLLDQQEPLV